MKDIKKARKLVEFQLGNHLKRLDTESEEFGEDERQSYAGKIAGLAEALEIIESAENGASVNDLDIGSETVSKFRERAQKHRGE